MEEKRNEGTKEEDGFTGTYLLLQGEDMGDAAIDGISDPSLSFISYGDDGLAAISHRDMQQQLGDIAGAEHLVNCGEPSWALLRAEVRRENAVSCALPPQELACTTRGATARSHDK